MAARLLSDRDATVSDGHSVDNDEDNTYLAEFFNFEGKCVGTIEVKCSTTFAVYPVTNSKYRFFEMRELKDPKRMCGVSNNFYEIEEPIEGEYLPYAIRNLLEEDKSGVEETLPQGWRLWLDSDTKVEPPSGFIPARSSKEALTLIKERGLPVVMDLEFDLGPNDSAENFMKDIVELLDIPFPPPPIMKIHTSNEAGRAWLLDYHDTWRRVSEGSDF